MIDSNVLAPAGGSLNRVEQALNEGWAAFKARPWLLTVPQVVLVPVGALISVLPFLIVGGVVSLAVQSADPSNAAYYVILFIIALFIGALLATALAVVVTGYAAAALRVARGEAVDTGDLFAGFRRVPGIVLAVLITGLAVAAVLAAAAIGMVVLVGVDRALQAMITHPLAAMLTSGLIYAIAVGIWLSALAAICYVLAGVSQWPFLLLNDGLGGRDAVATSWRMMRGRRLELVSLWNATAALNVVGLFALGFGVIFTNAIAVAAFAAFHRDLVGTREMDDSAATQGPRAIRTPLAAWAVDSSIVVLMAALFTLAAMIAMIAPAIAFARSSWSPYAPVWVLAGMTPLVIVPIAYFVLGRMLGGTPGQRIVGSGWGRFGWLGVVFGLSVLLEVGSLGATILRAPAGILSLAVGHEIARALVAELPAGYDSAPNNEGASDNLDLPATDSSEPTVIASYRITDTVGTPYRFALRRYFRTATADAAAARRRERGAVPEPAVGPDAFSVPDPDAGVVRVTVRAGDTLIAGEAAPEHADELKRLLRLQLDRLDAARDRVERVHGWLPVPAEQLKDDEGGEPGGG